MAAGDHHKVAGEETEVLKEKSERLDCLEHLENQMMFFQKALWEKKGTWAMKE